jgi:cerevisin
MASLCKWSLVAISLVSIVQATPLSTNPHYSPSFRSGLSLAPLEESHHPHGTLNDSYIVVLKKHLAPSHLANHLNFLQAAHNADPLQSENAGVRHVYDHFNGYSGRFTPQVVEQLRAMPEVDYIEKDQIVRTMKVQSDAPWVSFRSYLSDRG